MLGFRYSLNRDAIENELVRDNTFLIFVKKNTSTACFEIAGLKPSSTDEPIQLSFINHGLEHLWKMDRPP